MQHPVALIHTVICLKDITARKGWQQRCVCVCVCVWEREREREREIDYISRRDFVRRGKLSFFFSFDYVYRLFFRSVLYSILYKLKDRLHELHFSARHMFRWIVSMLKMRTSTTEAWWPKIEHYFLLHSTVFLFRSLVDIYDWDPFAYVVRQNESSFMLTTAWLCMTAIIRSLLCNVIYK